MPGGPRGARRRPANRLPDTSVAPPGCVFVSVERLPQYNDRCCHAASLSDEPEFDGETWRQYITDNHDEPDRCNQDINGGGACHAFSVFL
jgi:hypothetical protein